MTPLSSLLKRLQALVLAALIAFTLAGPAIAASVDDVAPEGVLSEQTAELASLGQMSIPLDLNRAILSAEAASLAIFNGLETTQNFVGKTERRKAAIEHGRNHASDKLKALIERARSAKSFQELSPTDRLVLKRLLGN
ncbi:MAG: hypothetical protein ACFB4J_05300 [Elainellaceae cyanobacterium]